MNTTLQTAVLKKGFAKLSKFCAGKLPIAEHVKIEARENETTFSVLMLHEYMQGQASITLPSETTVPGVTTMSFKKVHNFVKKSKAASFTFEETQVGSGATTLKQGYSQVDDFPLLPQKETVDVTLYTKDFKEAITKTAYAALTSTESRPILNGVNFQVSGSTCAFVATDSHRLAKYTLGLAERTPSAVNAAISAKMLQKITSVVEKTDTKMQMKFSVDGNYTLFAFDDMVVFTENIQGNYPDTTRLIPESYTTNLEVERVGFSDGLDLLQATIDLDKNNRVATVITSETFILAANDIDNKMESAVGLISHTGETLSIAYNAKFALDALKALNTDTVKIRLNDDKSPFVFEGENELHLILPIRRY